MIDSIVREKTGQKALEDLELDEIDRLLEDDMDDDRVMEEYRRKRMAEISALAAKEKFGSVRFCRRGRERNNLLTNRQPTTTQVYPISKPEFVSEVTDASKGGLNSLF